MKKFIFIILLMVSSMVNAQLTEIQKQEALSAASQFCNLLSQFSNGGTQYIGNDQRIFALCSSRNISAYDDIVDNKEVLLSSYLSLITKSYRNEIQFEFSQPEYSDYYKIPEFNTSIVPVMISNNQGFVTNEFDAFLGIAKYTDTFVIINVTQSIPKLGKKTQRKLIYSVGTHKIISFSNTQSPYLLMKKGLGELSNKNYQSGINYLKQTLSYPRFSDKQICYGGIAFGEVLLGNIDGAIEYYELIDFPQKRGVIAIMKAIKASKIEDYETVFMNCKIAADEGIEEAYYMLGLFYSSGIDDVCEQNEELAIYYYKKAANSKTDVVARTLGSYNLCVSADMGEINVSNEEYLQYAMSCAKEGYTKIYLHLYKYYYKLKRYDQCYHWALEAAKKGDRNGMALAGFYAIFSSNNKREGIEWLNKSIEGKSLEVLKEELAEDEGIFYDEFSSTEDVKELIRLARINQESNYQPQKRNNSLRDLIERNHSNASGSSTTVQQSDNNYSRPNYNSTNTQSLSNTSELQRYRSGYTSFNAPCDNYFVGFSLGYVQKQWTFKYNNGDTEKDGFWDDTNYIGGVQVGIRVNPQFVYGIGLNTGLFYEYYYSKSDPMNYTDDYGQYTGTLKEHALYLPLHLEYRLNFSEYFQLFFYGGLSFDYGLANSIKWVDCDDDNYSDSVSSIYDTDYSPDWERFNYSFDFGGGIRVSRFQLNFTMSKGLKNMSSTDAYEIHQDKNLMLSLSVMI